MHRFSFPTRPATFALAAAIVGLSIIPNQHADAANQGTQRLQGTGPNLYATFVNVVPRIDGTTGVPEWTDPTEITLNGFNDPSKTRTALLYSVVTATDLYIGIALNDPTDSSVDTLEVEFDSNHDGVATSGGEDSVIYKETHQDQHWGNTDWVSDAQQDGSGVRVYQNVKYTYEFKRPLNSGDGEDIAIGLGSTLGFRIETWDEHSKEYYRYPANTRAHGDTGVEWAKWANLTLAPEGVVTPPTAEGPSNGETLPAMHTILNWSNPAGTTQVQLQRIPANEDGPGVHLILNNSSSFNIPPPPGWYGLLPGMSYTWRMRATAKPAFAPENDTTWGPWSQGSVFRTPSRSSSGISSITPTPGATVNLDPRRLQWADSNGDIFYYEIQVSPDRNFGEQGAVASVWHNLVHGGVSNPPNSYLTPVLTAKTTYYWRVRARVQGDGTPVAWGPVANFKTD